MAVGRVGVGGRTKPTALKILNGKPGHNSLPENEPIANGDLTTAPEQLSPAQRAGWEYVIAHAPLNLLKLIDRATLTAFIVAEDLHRQATIQIEKHGMLVKHPETGAPMENPYVSILTKQATIMLRAANEMGLTPSSRSRVSISGPAKKTNPFLEFVGDASKTSGKK